MIWIKFMGCAYFDYLIDILIFGIRNIQFEISKIIY